MSSNVKVVAEDFEGIEVTNQENSNGNSVNVSSNNVSSNNSSSSGGGGSGSVKSSGAKIFVCGIDGCQYKTAGARRVARHKADVHNIDVVWLL